MTPSPVADTWARGGPYERYVGRWSRRVAPEFLDWLGAPAGRRWLDVGCGTGALTEAVLNRCEPTAVTGVEPSAGFLSTARSVLAERAVLLQGEATAIPLEPGSVDVVVSGLVLNFVADPVAALSEMKRVCAPAGIVGAYVWDYPDGGMQLMSRFWQAATDLDPGAAALAEGLRFPMCRPEALRALFEGAELLQVETVMLEIDTRFSDFDDYWQPFLGGTGPAPAYVMSLDEPARVRLRELLRERLPVASDGSIPLTARAWAVRGSV